MTQIDVRVLIAVVLPIARPVDHSDPLLVVECFIVIHLVHGRDRVVSLLNVFNFPCRHRLDLESLGTPPLLHFEAKILFLALSFLFELIVRLFLHNFLKLEQIELFLCQAAVILIDEASYLFIDFR
jgi:hypothetical protein